ncbi:pectinesterase protein [Spatholobus suberectus]|nr:pectinesterase protein [Spatholobus suberectus]
MKTQIPSLTHLSITLLLCLALSPCTATFNDAPTFETEADPPLAFPPSNENPTSSEEGSGPRHFYTSFSAAFADILRGALRGDALTLPPSRVDPKAVPHHDAVKQVCSHTDYPDACLATVAPFLGGGGGRHHHFDVMHVLEAAIRACSFQTNFTLAVVAKHTAGSPEMAAALADCREQYGDALGNLKRALEAIPSRDLGTVTVMLSAVMADVSACESGFQDLKAASPMGQSEGMVTITASNCLAIASMIPY